MKFEEHDVVYQRWYWDGIFAESVIFFNEDLKTLNEEKIKSDIKKTNLVSKDSELTYKKGEKYTFINFNFKTED